MNNKCEKTEKNTSKLHCKDLSFDFPHLSSSERLLFVTCSYEENIPSFVRSRIKNET
jgi:hypothetical protein